MTMKVGIALPHYDTSLQGRPVSWAGVKRVARRAEAAGLDSLWVSDHLFLDWSKYGGAGDVQGALECWSTISALAAATERVRLGTMAMCNDLRAPALVAKMAATVAVLAEDRLHLCLGAGWYEPEYRAADIPFDRPGKRIHRAGEAAEIIVRLLDGEEVTYKGEHYTIDGAMCRPVPSRRPPVYLGGKGDLLIRTAARCADGWNFSWIGSVEGYLDRARFADRVCEEQGRDPASLRRSVGVYLLPGRDESELQARFERMVERTPHGVAEAAFGDETGWRAFSRRGITGTIEEVIDALGRLSAAGVEEVILAFGVLPFQMADEDVIEVVGELIAPALQS